MSAPILSSTAFCLVAYKTESWTPQAIESFRKHFPDELLLIVDNNPPEDASCEKERAYLRDTELGKVIYPEKESDRSHGAGIDTAVSWCRLHGIKYLVLFEPDCLISGRKWFENLVESFSSGMIMAGSHRKIYGPIHPTPSLWDVSLVSGSFRQLPRGLDQKHPRFLELVNFNLLMDYCRKNYDPDVVHWFETFWDTGHKPWFEAAILDKAVVAKASDDFIHYWNGSNTTSS